MYRPHKRKKKGDAHVATLGRQREKSALKIEKYLGRTTPRRQRRGGRGVGALGPAALQDARSAIPLQHFSKIKVVQLIRVIVE